MRKRVLKNLIKVRGEDEFYSLIKESSESFCKKFDDNMDFTSTQIKIMVAELNITRPTYFFYGIGGL